jgi:hypothetical protein
VTAPAPNGANQTSAIQSAVNATPNGGTICLRPGTYRVDGQVVIASRTNLTFDGNGATMDAVSHSSDCGLDMLVISRSTGTRLLDVTLRGSHPNPSTYVAGCEWQHNVSVLASSDTEVGPNVTMDDAMGDCLYIDDNAVSTHLHDAVCRDNGRMGVAVIDARDILIERVTFTNMAYAGVDLEGDHSDQSVTGFEMRNTLMTGKAVNRGGNVWFSMGGNGVVSDVYVHDNRVEAPWGLYVGTCGGCPNQPRFHDIVITRNTATQGTSYGQGAPMYFQRMDRLTVTNNHAPSDGQRCTTIVDSTSVSVSGNTGCSPQT